MGPYHTIIKQNPVLKYYLPNLVTHFSYMWHMINKHTFLKLVLIFCLPVVTNAQVGKKTSHSAEAGVTIGAANLLSDLGGTIQEGRGFVTDIKFAATRPAVGLFLRYNINERFGIRLNGYYAQVHGDDAMINLDPNDPNGAGGWYRRYRNLNFRSHIIELSGLVEFNILPYIGGSMRERFSPYVFVGFGAFHFDPQTKHEGEWVKLQPLGTEGQGLPQYPEKEKYSQIALAFPFGAGIRYNITKSYTIGFEMSHRMTTTDYIDDVSTTYADPAYFYEAYSPSEAELVASLADRSSGEYPAVTSPGQQRGDPSDNDTYSFIGMFNLTYVFSGEPKNKGLYCPKLF